jgi:hypothetical protein
MAIVQRLRRLDLPFLFAADMSGRSTTKALASSTKLQGLTAGEADLRIYLQDGKMVHLELKTSKGKLSERQVERHAALRKLGHHVEVLYEADPLVGADRVERMVREWVKDATTNISPLEKF